jgi:ABC-type nitrate/sulfonate/bicarbonate transport system substrate-binding protein
MTKKVEPPIRPKLALLRRLIVGASLALAASHPAVALEAVSLQLKWKHQFQFAGYYQALAQGFYRDAGLDVTIREGGPGIDVSEAVAGGKADFSAAPAFCVTGQRAAGWSCWPPFSSVPRLSSWSPAAPTSAACRICAAVR